MRDKQLLTFRIGDGIAIGAVILSAVILFLFFIPSAETSGGKIVRIYQEGTLIHEMSLETDSEFLVNGQYENRIQVRDGKVAITESNCPGGDCVHSGWISQAGRSIVCLPNRAEVRVEGSSAQDVDAVVR